MTANPFEVTAGPAATDGESVWFEATVRPAPDADGAGVALDRERSLIDTPE